jgi:hypothetical protein
MHGATDAVPTLWVLLHWLLQSLISLVLLNWHAVVANSSFREEHNPPLVLRPMIPHPSFNRSVVTWFEDLLQSCLAFQIQVVWTKLPTGSRPSSTWQ